MHSALSVALATLMLTATASAQPPTLLAAMRDHYRPLLIFSGGDAKLAEQQMTAIVAHAPEANARQVLLVGVQGTSKSIQTALLSPAEEEMAEHRFGIQPGHFVVLLLGKDGGEKLRSSQPIPWSKLRSAIDAMPMRKFEASKPAQ